MQGIRFSFSFSSKLNIDTDRPIYGNEGFKREREREMCTVDTGGAREVNKH